MLNQDRFFGDFLVDRGDITAEDRAKALDIQRQSRTPIGQIALRSGRLDETDVIKILNLQKTFPNDPRRFGLIAIQLGLLEPNQVEHLLLEQQKSEDFIGEVLVSQQALTKPKMILALKKFHDSIK